MKTAIVTGAGSGIGAATTKCLLDAGWRVALLGRHLDRLEAVADRHEYALPIAVDVSDEQSVERGFDQVIDGRLVLGCVENLDRGASNFLVFIPDQFHDSIDDLGSTDLREGITGP